MLDWGRSAITSAAAVLGYTWVYIPLCRVLNTEPWPSVTYGLVLLGGGILLVTVDLVRNGSNAI